MLEANRRLVEQLDAKMKDFVSYQKMTYETMEEVRKLLQTFLFRKRITIFIFPAEGGSECGAERIRRRNTQASGRTERTSGGTSGGNEQKYEKYFQKPEKVNSAYLNRKRRKICAKEKKSEDKRI